MTKKEDKKKKTPSKKKNETKKNKEVERILIENFVDLQRVMAKLSERFDHLSMKISELLELFEESAKILVKKEIEMGKTDKYKEQLLTKIEKLLDQNKVIAKGLTLIHEHNLKNKENEEEDFLDPPPKIPVPIVAKSTPPMQRRFMPGPQMPSRQMFQQNSQMKQIPEQNQEYVKSPTVEEDDQKNNSQNQNKIQGNEHTFQMPQ